jgi:uncharacterized protein YfaS (alpha-2-macroglobulin family)
MKACITGISIIVSILLFLPCAPFAATRHKTFVDGFVFSAETNQPIKSAVIKLHLTKPKKPGVRLSVSSDDAGKFRFHLYPGIYEYTVEYPGFASFEGAVAVAGEEKSNLSIPLNREGVIQGRIVDSSGKSLPGLTVSIGDKLAAVTDKKGVFRITGVDARGYELHLAERIWVTEKPLYISMQAGEKKDLGDVTARRAGTIAIRAVTAGRGSSRPFPMGVLYLSGDLGYRSGKTNGRGEITFSGLAPGFYSLGSYDDRIEDPHMNVEVTEGERSVVELEASLRPPSLSLDSMEQIYLPTGPVRLRMRGLWVNTAQLTLYEIDARRFRDGSVDAGKPETIPSGFLTKVNSLSVQLKRERGSHHRSATVRLRKMKPGLYLVEAASGKTSTRALIFVTRLGIVAKASPTGTLLYAVDLINGKALKDVEIKAFAADTHSAVGSVFSARTDNNGIAEYSGPRTAVRIIGYDGGNTASLYLGGQNEGLQAERLIGYLYTERPVFRPGQTVFFKGIVRKRVGEGYALPGLDKVHVTIKDSGDQAVFEKDCTVNSAGSFNGEFSLPDNPALGDYTLKAEAKGQDWETSFKVLEYRKPEFAVTLTAPHKFRVGGEKEELSLQAKYYFGAPVAGAEVKYRIYSQPAYGAFPGGNEAEEAGAGDEESYYYGGYSDFIGEGEVTTDENGAAAIPVMTNRTDIPLTYNIEADLTDIASRQVSASTAFLVTPSLVALDVCASSFLAEPGKAVEFSVRTLTWDGKPVKTPVAVALEEQYRDRRTGITSFRTVDRLEIATDGAGRASFRHTFPRPGYWRVSTTAVDGEGRKSVAHDWVWVWREGYAWDSSYRELGVDLDKKSYKPGETARLIVKNPAPGAGILLSLEGRKIYSRRVIGPAGAVEVVEIPVLKEYAPYIFVSTTVVAKGRFYTQTKTLRVDYQSNRLDVKISSDKPVYAPGETARLTITTSGTGGVPAAAELSLGVVDEAIYAVSSEQREDIYRFFRGNREQLVLTLNSFPRVYLGGKAKDASMASPAPEGMEKVKVRKVFKDTAYWAPVLETDARGRANAEIVLPDNLTTWRATAIAHTDGSDFGSGMEKFISRLDVMARLQPPRFFILGDEMKIPGIINNMTTEELQVNGRFDAEGLTLVGDGRFDGKVAAAGSLRHDMTVRADRPGLSLLRLTVAAGDRGDAMELQVPVLPRAIKRESLGNMALRGVSGETSVEFPGEAEAEGASLRVTLAPTLAASLNESLRELVDFPYGCVEQTMSRFLPAVYVRGLLVSGRFSLDEDVARKLPKVLDEGLKRLYDFQHEDGGWEWWKEDSSDPYMTAYVVYGLALSQKSGVTVNPEVMERGVNALLELAKKADIDSLPFSYRSLTIAGKNDVSVEKKIEAAWTQLRPSQQIYYVEALMNNGQKERAARLLSVLKKQVKREGSAAYLKDDDALSWWYSWRWSGSAVETTAMLLERVLAANPSDQLAPALAEFLVRKRSGRWWNTTRATAVVVKALADYVAATGESEASYSARLLLNGREIEQLAVKDGKIVRGDSLLVIPSTRLQQGTNRIQLEKSAPGGALYLTAALDYLVPPEYASRSKGLSIERKLYRIKSVKDGKDWRMEYVPLYPGENLSPGDDIEVRLVVDNNDDMNFVIIEDCLPAGFEVRETKTDLRFARYSWFWDWYVHAERHDERMAFFLDDLPAGRHEFRYVMYPELEGTSLALPASVWPMYVPSLKSESSPWKVKVIQ